MISKILNNEELRVMFLWLFIVIGISFFFFIYLWRNIEMSLLKYDIQKLKDKKNTLLIDIENNHLKISQYLPLSHIEEVVKNNQNKLGYNQKMTILKLNKLP